MAIIQFKLLHCYFINVREKLHSGLALPLSTESLLLSEGDAGYFDGRDRVS